MRLGSRRDAEHGHHYTLDTSDRVNPCEIQGLSWVVSHSKHQLALGMSSASPMSVTRPARTSDLITSSLMNLPLPPDDIAVLLGGSDCEGRTCHHSCGVESGPWSASVASPSVSVAGKPSVVPSVGL